MWISEPPDCYDARQARLHSPARLGWDHDILMFLGRNQGRPVHFMRAVNSVARTREHDSNRRKVAAKREIILALGRLVRVGRVTRVRRKYVVLPAQSEVILPHLFA